MYRFVKVVFPTPACPVIAIMGKRLCSIRNSRRVSPEMVNGLSEPTVSTYSAIDMIRGLEVLMFHMFFIVLNTQIYCKFAQSLHSLPYPLQFPRPTKTLPTAQAEESPDTTRKHGR